MLRRLEAWARRIKRDVVAVWLASRDPRVSLHVKALAILVVGYALSPIDLIPDFIPVLGYLDDAVIVPIGILLVVKLIPDSVMAEHRTAASRVADMPQTKAAAVVIVAIWIVATIAGGWWFYRYVKAPAAR
jgi:uncharacterized membrane protein YkvA (DUF1232 family)